MGVEDDEQPRVVLEGYRVVHNLPKRKTIFDEVWRIETFKKVFGIVVVRKEENEMEFDLVAIHPALANTFRRIMLSEVPSMAIDKVHIMNNTSIIQDEVLAHRLGLIPLKADPRLFEYKSNPTAEGTENDTLEFNLKIKCTYNKDGNKDSSCAEDMYKNNNVYSKHIKWLPIGNQKEKFTEKSIGPISDDILLAKLRPGHEIDMKLIAVKSTGKDHTKFSPVATVYYRLLPEIFLRREVEGEAAERMQKCFSPGVIGIREKDNKKYAVVENSRYDTSCRNVYRYPDLKDAVAVTKVKDHFIFNIESVGAMELEVIFKEAVLVLKNKCLSLLDELSNKVNT